MQKAVLILVAATLFLAGCTTPITFSKVTKERFTAEIPSNWKEFAADPKIEEIAYFSDGKDAEVFYDGAMSVYVHVDYYEVDTPFDQKYCEELYGVISSPTALGEFSGINKKEVKFVAESNGVGAHCDLQYEMLNNAKTDFADKQLYRRYLFIDGTDIVDVAVATTKSALPDYAQRSLDSFRVISKSK